MTCTRPQAKRQKKSLDPWAPSTHDPFRTLFVGQAFKARRWRWSTEFGIRLICQPSFRSVAAIFNRCSSHMMYRPREFRSDGPRPPRRPT